MAHLRLFANLREAAGTDAADIPGGTVTEVLDNATARFGDDFAAGLATARVWVNGEPVEPEQPVGDEDEVALIPPVSGGATVVRAPVGIEIGIVAILGIFLFIANAASLQWYAVVVVLAAGLWAFDISEYAARRQLPLATGAILAGILGGTLATYRWGLGGMAAATVGSVLAVLLWAVLFPRLRPLPLVATSVSLAVVATFGVSSMIVLRLRSSDEATAFLVVAVSSVVIAWLFGQADIPGLDPLVTGILAALVSGLVAGTIWGEDIWPTLVAAAGAAVAIVAGKNLGSLVRAGGFFLTGPVPGSLHHFDPIIMAAGPFWLLLEIFV